MRGASREAPFLFHAVNFLSAKRYSRRIATQEPEPGPVPSVIIYLLSLDILNIRFTKRTIHASCRKPSFCDSRAAIRTTATGVVPATAASGIQQAGAREHRRSMV